MIKLTLIKLWIFATIFILVMIILELATGILGLNELALIFLSLYFLIGFFVSLFLIQGVHSISITETSIIATNLITKRSFSLQINEFSEFNIYIHVGRLSGFQFDLILRDTINTYEPISLNYLDNVNDLVTELEKRLRNTTKDEYGILDFLKKQRQNQNSPQQ